MKITLIIFLNFIVFTTFCQLEDRYKNHLHGQVKECSEMGFSVTIKNNKLTTGSYISHWSRGIRRFDTKGNVIEFQTHPDTVTGKFEKTILIYDESDCLKEIRFFTSDGKLDRLHAYKCDENGKLIEEIDYNFEFGKDPLRTYTFRYLNNNLAEIHEQGNGTATSSEEYFEYDKNGFLIRKKGYGTYEYVNDEIGRPLVEYIILKDNSRRIIKELKYNEKGLVSEQAQYFRGQKSGVFYSNYQFDENGNWITRFDYFLKEDGSKTPVIIIVRKITYY